ncbi:MAG: methyltransferase domain-containing protein [Candidatus Omnitrophica bacterium]|nr:methyltransferase domain-containing protein [Candidatus Omnitrophota bacterium]
MSETQLENLDYGGEGRLEKIPCPLCGSEKFEVLVVEHTIPVVRCVACRLVFANPRPNREGLQKFYNQYFPPESETLWQIQMARVFRREGLEKIKQYQELGILRPSSPPRLLDVGCGMGFFLDLMRNEGWEVVGVEPAPEAVRHARERLKLEVVEGTIEIAHFGASFDVVTLWYVLEHVPNPGEILKMIASFLKPGGILILRVPNQSASIDRWLSLFGLKKFFLMNPPRHLFDYSAKTIRAFLEKTGYDVLEVRNSIPRATGTWLELIRRHLWYLFFQVIYFLTGKKIVQGSSITVYARRKS